MLILQELDFYKSTKHLAAKGQRQREKAAQDDRIVDAILKMADESSGRKVKLEDVGKKVFVIGMGDFGTFSGKTSPHKGVYRYFAQKVFIASLLM